MQKKLYNMLNHGCLLSKPISVNFLLAIYDRKLEIIDTLEQKVNIDEFTEVRNEIRVSDSEGDIYHKVVPFPCGQLRWVSEGLLFSPTPQVTGCVRIFHIPSLYPFSTVTVLSFLPWTGVNHNQTVRNVKNVHKE